MLNSRIVQAVILVLVLGVAGTGGWIAIQRANAVSTATNTGPFSDARLAADKAFEANDYTNAVVYYREMVQKDPYNCWAHLNMGRSLLELILEERNRISETTSETTAGVEASPENSETTILDQLYAEAFVAFEAGSELRILRTACIYHIARLHYLQKDHDKAIEVLSTLPPRESRYQRNMERDFADLKDREQFKELVKQQSTNNQP